MDLSYDLHIHSCLSPCGDNDMTPNNIINMASMLGLDVIAVSDHNSARNLPAIFKVAEDSDIVIVPAIEVCTNEEVHILCLFKSLSLVQAFDEELYTHLPFIKNDEDAFGCQIVMDEQDNPIATEQKLLINAVDIGIDKLLKILHKYDGLAIPAHVDKQSNSIISSLGYIPDDYNFSCIEVKNPNSDISFSRKKITNSDAHYLEHIGEPVRTIPVTERTASAVVTYLDAR